VNAEQRERLLAHFQSCSMCEDLLIDRRALAYRWRIAGAIPALGLGVRRLVRDARSGAVVHPLGTVATTAAVAALAVAGGLLIPGHSPPVQRVTASIVTTLPAPPTRLTAPASTTAPSTTAPSTAPPPITPSTVTTTTSPAPVPYELEATAVTDSIADNAVEVQVQSSVTFAGAPVSGDRIRVTAPSCTTGSGATNADGVAVTQVECVAGTGPIELTVVEQHGATMVFSSYRP
jgi:hypothetical protein